MLLTAILLALVWAAYRWDERRVARAEAAFAAAYLELAAQRSAYWRARLALAAAPGEAERDEHRLDCERRLIAYRGALGRLLAEHPVQMRRAPGAGSYADPELKAMVEAMTGDPLPEALLRHAGERVRPAHAARSLAMLRRPVPHRTERVLGGAVGALLGLLPGAAVFVLAYRADTSAHWAGPLLGTLGGAALVGGLAGFLGFRRVEELARRSR